MSMPAAAFQEPKTSALETLQFLAFPQPGETAVATQQRQILYTNGILTLAHLAQLNPSLGSTNELLTILEAHAFSHDLGIAGLESLVLYLMNSQINHENWEALERLWDTCDPSKTADAGAWVPGYPNGTHCLLFASTVLTLKNGGIHRAGISPGLPIVQSLADATVTFTYNPTGSANAAALTLDHAPLLWTVSPGDWTIIVSPSRWSDATWIKGLKFLFAIAATVGASIVMSPAAPLVGVLLVSTGAAGNLVVSELDFVDSLYKDTQITPLKVEPPQGDITVDLEPDTGGGPDSKGKLAFDQSATVFDE